MYVLIGGARMMGLDLANFPADTLIIGYQAPFQS